MSEKSEHNPFPRLLKNEELETAIRGRWFEEHPRNHSVYALYGDEFVEAIEDWVRKTFPDNANDAKTLAGVIWLSPLVIEHQKRVSGSWTGAVKRLLIPRGELKHRWDADGDK